MSKAWPLAGVMLPVGLLGLAIWLFLATGAGLDLAAPAPIENVAIERVTLQPGLISAYVRNTGPDEIVVALVSVNESIWPATASPSERIPRLGVARIDLQFPWVTGESYRLAFFTANGVVFHKEIPVAVATPLPSLSMLASFTLVGLYVGVIPIALGLAWLPVLRLAGRKAVLFLTALTAGVLVILGIDTGAEALNQAAALAPPLQGLALVALAIVATFALLRALSFRGGSKDMDDPGYRLGVSYLIALGIGLHNLGEGLAIGAAYSLGEVGLGVFLVVGFMVQNLTEGVAILVPILRSRIRLLHIVALGALAGIPTIFGTSIGGFSYSPLLGTLFLAIGAGAIFQVLYDVGRLAMRETERLAAPLVAFAGVLSGMLVLYLTGLFVL